jgi:hypothetical protein
MHSEYKNRWRAMLIRPLLTKTSLDASAIRGRCELTVEAEEELSGNNAWRVHCGGMRIPVPGP